MMFKEAFLHFIWRYRLFNQLNLKTTDQESLEVLSVGQLNSNAGPDFEFAKIRVNGTLWSGHVEIHLKEEDWFIHKHHLDEAYDNTILHVVWESSSRVVHRSDGTIIPTLLLGDIVESTMINHYKLLMENLDWIPCAKQMPTVDSLTVINCLSRLAVERLAYKFDAILLLLKQTNQDWERVFLIVLGRAFGMKVNSTVFENLFMQLNIQLIHKYKLDRLKIESLLFGQAGFLKSAQDDYTRALSDEYSYLKKIYSLVELSEDEWRFLRMRPYNFPTYRLGQLAGLLSKQTYWFSVVRDVDRLDELFDLLELGEMNEYWSNHYRFGVVTGGHSVRMSLSFKIHLAINCFIPMLFAFGCYMKEEKYKEKALHWLSELPAEVNQITKKFREIGIKCQSAADSQALLCLKQDYCDAKRCLNCSVGLSILRPKAT